MTTHANLMSGLRTPDKADPNPNCTAKVDFIRRVFWDDVSWHLFHCPKCDIVIAAVGGYSHWWNYVVTNPAILGDAAAHPSDPAVAGSGTAEGTGK